MGREVTRLIDGMVPAGYRSVVWNGKDKQDREVPAGIFIARLMTPGYSNSIEVVLLK